MKKQTTAAVLVALMMSTAQAGFFDIFSSTPEKFDWNGSNAEIVKIPVNEKVGQNREPDFSAKKVELLAHHTQKVNIEDLKLSHKEVIEILSTFEALENNLVGYEERAVVTSLKNFFRDKYLISQADLISIKTNLNQVLNR